MSRSTPAAFKIEVEPDISEHVGLAFSSSDLCGGDAGNGAWAVLKLRVEGGSYKTMVLTDEGETEFDPDSGYMSITLMAQGDWEITGFAENIVKLGDKLRPFVEARNRARAEAMAALSPADKRQMSEDPRAALEKILKA